MYTCQGNRAKGRNAGVRKVRASQSRITDNVRRRRLPGECNRDIPAMARKSTAKDGKAR